LPARFATRASRALRQVNIHGLVVGCDPGGHGIFTIVHHSITSHAGTRARYNSLICGHRLGSPSEAPRFGSDHNEDSDGRSAQRGGRRCRLDFNVCAPFADSMVDETRAYRETSSPFFIMKSPPTTTTPDRLLFPLPP
jgi:hypothetical protein